MISEETGTIEGTGSLEGTIEIKINFRTGLQIVFLVMLGVTAGLLLVECIDALYVELRLRDMGPLERMQWESLHKRFP